MKKTIFLFLLAFATVFTMNAQNENDNDTSTSSQWKMRFRVISVIPSPGDNLNIDGAEIAISTSFVPEVDFTYFFTENLAAELILATTKHNVEVDINGGDNVDLGHAWLLPPTLNLQYHFTGGQVTPYIGAGVNYTIFYGVKSGDVDGIDYDSSFGFSFQGGLDYDLDDKWFINVDVKKILLKTDVTVDTGEGLLPVEVDINPLVVGLGAGFKF
jgi:outer membrane protein